MQNNSLDGRIPESIGDLTKLTLLSVLALGKLHSHILMIYRKLHINELVGNIPKSVGQLTNLTKL